MNTTTQYLYLIQEREFKNSKQNIYKVGMTKKENLVRFKQYPKGSILLFQIICSNCNKMEKDVLKKFKKIFTQKKDIGTEYFEGDYKNMIDIIYDTVKNECENDKQIEYLKTADEKSENDKQIESLKTAEEDEEEEDEDEDEEEEDEEEEKLIISTYEDYIKYNRIKKIVITNKNGQGFLRFEGEGQLWREIGPDEEENLLEYIEHWNDKNLVKLDESNIVVTYNEMYNYKNKATNEIITQKKFYQLNVIEREDYDYFFKKIKYTHIEVEYDVNDIFKDIIKKCVVKKPAFFNLDYHDYILRSNDKNNSLLYVLFNSITFTFIPVDKLINNKILTKKDCGEKCVSVNNIVNIDVVNDILNSLITNEIKLQYKQLVYNLIVNQTEQTKSFVFYDYNNCLLKEWIICLLYAISKKKFYIYSYEYYDNKLEVEKLLTTLRCVIIKEYPNITIKEQIDEFSRLGIKNIIVCQQDEKNTMYNISNFRKYLNDNKESLLKCIKEENNCEFRSHHWEKLWYKTFDDDIFYNSDLLWTNFLKWCCVK